MSKILDIIEDVVYNILTEDECIECDNIEDVFIRLGEMVYNNTTDESMTIYVNKVKRTQRIDGSMTIYGEDVETLKCVEIKELNL